MWFGILGPLEVTVRSIPVRIPGMRQRRILATLALHANTPVPIERLVDVLWGEAPPRTAREQVQNCTGQLARCLRSASGTDPIVRRPGSYTIYVADTNLDSLELAAAIRRSRKLSRAGCTDDAQRARRAALDLWRGDVLADLLTPGMQPQITRLEEIRTTAVEQYVDAAIHSGDYDAAIAELTTAVARHPFNERLCERLMRALRAAGRSADALIVYAQLRDRLAEELNLAPEPGLTQLQREIVLSAPQLTAPDPLAFQPTASVNREASWPRHPAKTDAIRLLREATQLLHTALGLLDAPTGRAGSCQHCAGHSSDAAA